MIDSGTHFVESFHSLIKLKYTAGGRRTTAPGESSTDVAVQARFTARTQEGFRFHPPRLRVTMSFQCKNKVTE